MEVHIRAYQESDLAAMIEIWNEVVDDGVAFPQTEPLSAAEARQFFASQDFTAVAEYEGRILGLYILHPNNIGRCGHLANASYAVSSAARGRGIGELLVRHSLSKCRELGFRVLQFNAVVESNAGAIHLYEKLGFIRLGMIPAGFQVKDGSFQNIILYYHPLE